MALWQILRRFLGAAGQMAASSPDSSESGRAGFTVMVAPVEGDDGSLVEALTKALGAVEGLRVTTTAAPGSVTPSEPVPATLAQAVRRARAQAEHARARCVVWGTARDGLLRLWVVPAELDTEPPGCAVLAGDMVTLPLPLRDEGALALAVLAILVALPLDSDAERTRRLEMLRGPLAAVEPLLLGEPPRLPERIRPAAAQAYAAALAEIGWRSGQTALLDKAIDVQHAALAKARAAAGDDGGDEVNPLLSPSQTAAGRARLADLLADVGWREKDAEKLQRAAVWYRKALDFYSFGLLPDEYARTSAQRGRACHRLAHMTGKTTWMRDAVTAYRDAARVWTKAAQPAHWAEMQSGIGGLLSQMGEFSGKAELFERAARVLTGVMDVWTREEHPRRWAGLHNNIGACRFAQGKLGGDTPALRAALEHFSFALEVYEQFQMTRNIHVTQKNIARVERLIGAQDSHD